MMRSRIITLGLLAGFALAGAGCSGSASKLLSTGSLSGGKPPPPKPVTATDRVLQVAATAARARKCGYFFDTVKLRTAYLASEAQLGAKPDELANLTKAYDYTYNKVSTLLAGQENYCTPERTTAIKKSLTRHLAGDFAPAKGPRQVAGGGLFDYDNTPTEREVINPDWVHNPRIEPPTKKVDPDE